MKSCRYIKGLHVNKVTVFFIAINVKSDIPLTSQAQESDLRIQNCQKTDILMFVYHLQARTFIKFA